MKHFSTIITASLALTLLAGCGTDEDFYYNDHARVRLVGPEIWTVGTDSLTFSFVSVPSETTEQTLLVDARIMGTAANRDRTARLAVDATRTTAPQALYSVPTEVLIPADSTHARFPVVIRRDASLRSATVRLRIEVAASDDFLPGVNEENHLTFIWSDKLTMPANWPDLEEFFGAYSDTKYRFMLENSTPGTTFSIDTMSWAMLMSYKIKFQNAVRTYNAAHPGNALTDENGNLVTFE